MLRVLRPQRQLRLCVGGGIRCELVPGSTLLGCAGDDYVCTHDKHVCGDECLSFQLSPELVEALDDRPATWRAGALPAGTGTRGARRTHPGRRRGGGAPSRLEEGGPGSMSPASSPCFTPPRGPRPWPMRGAGVRRRAVEAALWIEENAQEEINLGLMARATPASAAFHFLRLFTGGAGGSPRTSTSCGCGCGGRRACLPGSRAPSATRVSRRGSAMSRTS